MDKFSLRSKAQDIRVEISENIKDQSAISHFVQFLRQQEIHPFFDSSSRFKVSFALKRDIIRVGLAHQSADACQNTDSLDRWSLETVVFYANKKLYAEAAREFTDLVEKLDAQGRKQSRLR